LRYSRHFQLSFADIFDTPAAQRFTFRALPPWRAAMLRPAASAAFQFRAAADIDAAAAVFSAPESFNSHISHITPRFFEIRHAFIFISAMSHATHSLMAHCSQPDNNSLAASFQIDNRRLLQPRQQPLHY
jgi:hypothetical protein